MYLNNILTDFNKKKYFLVKQNVSQFTKFYLNRENLHRFHGKYLHKKQKTKKNKKTKQKKPSNLHHVFAGGNCFAIGGSINIPWKIPNGKVLAHLGFKSGHLSAWVGFCTSNPQQGVRYQLWYAVKCHALGHSLLYK